MKNKPIIAIILIVIGVAILAYGHFSYRTTETVLDVGPIKATAEKTNTVPVPPLLGWVLIAIGAGVLILPARSKS